MQNRMKERIRQSGRLQVDIAKELGMTSIGLSQLVSSKMPKMETFEKIAKALGVPVWSLCLSDEEIDEIRKASSSPSSGFRCPSCGAPLMVVSAGEHKCE